MNNLLSLTSKQLHRAADLKEKIEALNKELASILGAPASVSVKTPKKRGMSAAGRAAVAAAQKARWAKIKGAKPAKKAPAKRRTMSAAAKAKISAAAKARWAKARAAGKKSL
jgi:glycerol kinase